MPNKNTTAAVDAFIAGKSHKKCRSIWTNGTELFSYNVCIAYKCADNTTHAVVNAERYSVTTSRHQNALRVLLRQSGWTCSEYYRTTLFI
jgi:hypothetical protein